MNKLLEKPNICNRCHTTCIEKEEKVIICSDVEFRCKGWYTGKDGNKRKCNKLLAKGNGDGLLAGSIKCPICGEMNER